MEKAGIKIPKQIRLSGGGSKSKLLRKILADVLGVPTVLLSTTGGAEIGDTFIAGEGIGVFKNYDKLRENIKIVEKIVPDDSMNKLYQRIYSEVYKEIYPALKNIFSKLAKLTSQT